MLKLNSNQVEWKRKQGGMLRMSDVFQACRERVSAEEAARLYGIVAS